MKIKFSVDVLDYVITSNHIHLLLWSKKAKYVSAAMHFLQSVSAKDYNARVKREGAFWRGRYHPTIIEPGSHLAHCLFYIDLNMLRAGVVKHPAEWRYSGYHELAKKRSRYCIINIDRLTNCLEINNRDIFHKWYLKTLNEEVEKSYHCRKPVWSESIAIGSKDWIKNISHGLLRTKIIPILNTYSRLEINESAGMYSLTRAGNTKREFWKNRQKKS
jgi:putative transposase